MGNRSLLVFLTLFFGCTVTGWTQKAPAFELFGGYSGLNVDMRQYYHQTPTIYNFRNRYTTLSGAEFSITENKNRHFGGTFDLGFHTRSPNVNGVKNRQRTYTFMYGPRLSTRLGFVKPFAHFLLGAAYEKVEVTPGPHASDLSFAFAPGGGVDIHLGERASIRALQVDYFRSSNLLVSRPQGFRAAAGFGWSFGALK